MEDNKDLRTKAERVMLTVLGALAVGLTGIALILALSGCASAKPVVMERVTVRTDTLYKERMKADTLRIRDSVFVWQYAKGDTVYMEKTAWRWREKVSVRVDTVYKQVTREDKDKTVVGKEKKLPAPVLAFLVLMLGAVAVGEAVVWWFRKRE